MVVGGKRGEADGKGGVQKRSLLHSGRTTTNCTVRVMKFILLTYRYRMKL